MQKINVEQKFSQFSQHWDPKIVGELNDQQVKLVKFQGEFVWHKHENEDELFFVVKGSFVMEFREENIELNEGEFLIVPKGVEHKPVAENEAWVMLFEPSSTLNTGNLQNAMTKTKLEKL
jgi:mannose-6-phosphate isomerase-like protein (cupin superfamily)